MAIDNCIKPLNLINIFLVSKQKLTLKRLFIEFSFLSSLQLSVCPFLKWGAQSTVFDIYSCYSDLATEENNGQHSSTCVTINGLQQKYDQDFQFEAQVYKIKGMQTIARANLHFRYSENW